MSKRKQTQVLVAGAGPVGLMAALCLRHRGLDVVVVDKAPIPATHSYALALHSGSIEEVRAVGIGERLMEYAEPVKRMSIWESSGKRKEIPLGAGSDFYPLFSVIGQDRLESLLIEALSNVGVEVLWSHRLSRFTEADDGVHVEIERLEEGLTGYAIAQLDWRVRDTIGIDAEYVIGADGHGSVVRQVRRIPYPAVGEPEYYAVFEGRGEHLAESEMRLVVHEGLLGALWPLPDGCFRWAFEISAEEARSAVSERDRRMVQVGAATYPGLTDDAFFEFIEQRAPWFRPRGSSLSWRVLVRFEHRLAASFGCDRVWLAGDAVHTTGPIGVQSMNAAFVEVWDLAERIAARLLSSPSAPSLEDYGVDHLEDWRRRQGVGHRLISTSEWPLESIPAHFLSAIPAHGEAFSRILNELGLGLVSSRD